MGLFRFIAGEKSKADVDVSDLPYAEKGDMIEDIEVDGKQTIAVLISSHPFDGNDFRCATTGNVYCNYESSNWRTIK